MSETEKDDNIEAHAQFDGETNQSTTDADGDHTDAVEANDAVDVETVPEVDNYHADADDSVDQDIAPVAAQPKKRGAALPWILVLLLGGGLGAGGWFVLNERTAMRDNLATQSEAIDALEAKIAELNIPDLSPLEAAIATVQIDTAAQAEADDRIEQKFDAALADLRQTIAATELVASGGQADAASAGQYIQEVEARLAHLESNAADLSQSSAELRAEADAAEAAARKAQAQAQLSIIMQALDSGAPFAEQAADLEQFVELPAALGDAAEYGVSQQSQLLDEWPALARAALAITRNATDADTSLGSLFAKQFQMRSTTPREGSDPDAVMSRVEGAMRAGDLEQALNELDGLPDSVTEIFAPWRAQTQARRDALVAAQQLHAQIELQNSEK